MPKESRTNRKARGIASILGLVAGDWPDIGFGTSDGNCQNAKAKPGRPDADYLPVLRSGLGCRRAVAAPTGSAVGAVDGLRHARAQVVGFLHGDAVERRRQPERLLAVGGPGDHRLVGEIGLDAHQKAALDVEGRRDGRRGALGGSDAEGCR